MKKEEAIKGVSLIFLPICVFIKGIQTAIKQKQKYNHAIKTLSNSKVIKSYFATPINPEIKRIQQSTPFTYNKAEEIYNLSQEYCIPIDLLVEFVIKSGLCVMEIREIIEKK